MQIKLIILRLYKIFLADFFTSLNLLRSTKKKYIERIVSRVNATCCFCAPFAIIIETMKVCRSEASLEINAKPYLLLGLDYFWDSASEWWIAASFSDCQRQFEFKDLLIINVKRCIFEQRGTASLIYLILSKSLKVLKYQILSSSYEKIFFFTREGVLCAWG